MTRGRGEPAFDCFGDLNCTDLRIVFEFVKTQPMILSFGNVKGRVGKTMLAVSIAIACTVRFQ